jgi:hypothetical protein
VVNLGTDNHPQNINLGTNFSPMEKQAFIKLFKEYKDIFSWTYDDLKTYETKIIQHIIPMKPQIKIFQHKVEEDAYEFGTSSKSRIE